jgi:hypothetical protein
VTNYLLSLFQSSTPFWIGFIVFILLAYIAYRLRRYILQGIRSIINQMGGMQESFFVNTEIRLRNDIYHHAQKQHLTSTLFSLDEIAIVPKVITPIIQSASSPELAPTDSVSLTVPYIPDWPELAAVYKASTLDLIEALQGGANIILAGHPGSGKTVALAWLASALARNQAGLGILAGLLPLYVHAQDVHHFLHYKAAEVRKPEDIPAGKSTTSDIFLQNGQITGDPVEVLIRSISAYVSGMTLPRLPGIVREALERGHAILILDGMDELPPSQAAALRILIEAINQKYPKLRVIVSLSYEDMAGVPALGFSLLAMAAWGESEMSSFLARWSRLWAKWIYPSEKDQASKINPYYLNSWLKVNPSLFKPLDYVLKVWAAYSGDIRGADGPSAIEAYIQRATLDAPKLRLRLEQFALQQLIEIGASPTIDEPEITVDETEVETNPLNHPHRKYHPVLII